MAIGSSASLVAQATVQANYPLLTDLADASGNYADGTLRGAPPPAPPANGVCTNGIYTSSPPGSGRMLAPGSQEFHTADLFNLNSNDFQIEVSFRVDGMPYRGPGFVHEGPILVVSPLWRWFGLALLNSAGTSTATTGELGVSYNNSLKSWSATTVNTGQWYSAMVRYEAGTVELYLDGARIHQASIGTLNTGGTTEILTTDYAFGNAFNGCIRNLRIWNDPDFSTTAAGEAMRLASPPNPLLLLGGQTNRPIVGQVWDPHIANPPSGAVLNALVIGVSSVSIPLQFGTLLCIPSLTLQGLPGAPFQIPLPPNPALIGASLCTQGASATASALQVSNAIDVTFGNG